MYAKFLFVVFVATALISVVSGQKQARCLEDAHSLSVTAEGRVNIKPDLALLDFNTVAKDASASVAYKKHLEQVRAVLSAVKESGVESKDLQTRNLSLQPHYRYSKNENKQIFEHFLVEQTLTVTVRDVDIVSKVVDVGVEAGGLIQGIHFTVEDTEEAAAAASAKAYAQLKRKTDAIAKKLGVTLGKPIKVTDSGAEHHVPQFRSNKMMKRGGAEMAMVADDMGGPTVETGEIKISHTVDAVFEIL